jgi:hypothetical protein
MDHLHKLLNCGSISFTFEETLNEGDHVQMPLGRIIPCAPTGLPSKRAQLYLFRGNVGCQVGK